MLSYSPTKVQKFSDICKYFGNYFQKNHILSSALRACFESRKAALAVCHHKQTGKVSVQADMLSDWIEYKHLQMRQYLLDSEILIFDAGRLQIHQNWGGTR